MGQLVCFDGVPNVCVSYPLCHGQPNGLWDSALEAPYGSMSVVPLQGSLSVWP